MSNVSWLILWDSLFTLVLLTCLYLRSFQLTNLMLALVLFWFELLLFGLARPRQEGVQLSLLLIVQLHHLCVAVHYVCDLPTLVCLCLEGALVGFVIWLEFVHHGLPWLRVVVEHELGALLGVDWLYVDHANATAQLAFFRGATHGGNFEEELSVFRSVSDVFELDA